MAGVRRILVVEDEQDIRDLLKELLESSVPSVEVSLAPTGGDGLRMMELDAFDLIITDFKMPGMNGLEFLQAARARSPDTPRVLMTAFPDLDIAVRSINEAHIENFFAKPLDPDEIVEKVTRILDMQEARVLRERAFARSANLLADRLRKPE